MSLEVFVDKQQLDKVRGCSGFAFRDAIRLSLEDTRYWQDIRDNHDEGCYRASLSYYTVYYQGTWCTSKGLG